MVQMIYGYREIYGLVKYIKEIKKEISDLKNIEVYSIIPFGLSFVELNASSVADLKCLDLQFISRVITFCERKNILNHLFFPLELL